MIHQWSLGASTRLEIEIGGSSLEEQGLKETYVNILSLYVSDSQIEVSCPGLSADLIFWSAIFRAQASESSRPEFSDLLVLRPQFLHL